MNQVHIELRQRVLAALPGFPARLLRTRRVVLVTVALLVAAPLAGLSRAADASVLPSGFQDSVVLSG